ncbi:MAG: hypothetical protein Q7R78_00065 [bacterium]|nr:hypothetical protein [bacterium]
MDKKENQYHAVKALIDYNVKGVALRSGKTIQEIKDDLICEICFVFGIDTKKY